MATGDSADSTIDVLLSAIDVSRKLGKCCGGFPRNVWSLMDIVEASLAHLSPTKRYDIRVHPRVYGAKHIIGSIDAFDSEAHIYYDLNQNPCWRRFIVTKELCHLLFAPFGDKHLASTPTQVEQLITQLLSGLGNAVIEDHVYGTEWSSVLLATEILMPYSERGNVQAMFARQATRLDIAKHYRLPEQLVGLYLSPIYTERMHMAYKLAPQETP